MSDQADAKKMDLLDANGITAVVNLTPYTDDFPKEFKDRIAYLRLNQEDGQPILAETLKTFLGFMNVELARGRTVLIHCAAGVSRTSAFAIAWFIHCGFGWDEAENMTRIARQQIAPNPVLKESILEFFKEQLVA
jgi:protein-tyrosine phosphatase